jgi:hypothetical protein
VLRLKEAVRRRVRKSRQKEAAGAADAGLMQIEWSEAEGLKLGGVAKAAGVAASALCKEELKAEVSLGGDGKKLSGGNGDTLRRDARKRVDSAVCGRVISCGLGQERWRTKLELCPSSGHHCPNHNCRGRDDHR